MVRFLLLFFISIPALALKTAYVSFDTPDGWRCDLSEGVWICQTMVETHRKDSVVLSIASLATDWDTLDNYEKYLNQTRTIRDDQGKSYDSKIIWARRRKINQIEWIDSLQFNSEIPGFYARYLGTTHTTGQTKLAILITYVVSGDKYAYFSPLFDRMIATLKPNTEFDINIPSMQGELPLHGNQKLGSVPKILAERLDIKKRQSTDLVEVETESSSRTLPTILFLILLAAAGVYLIIRRRRKKRVDQM